LVGILLATFFAGVTQLEVQRIEVPSNMLSEVTLPTVSWLELLTSPMVLTGALVIGLVASAETLLCATAVDQMHQGPRTKYDKELSAQGVGNVLCGLVGALPMTGVIVRSSANVNSGAKSRLSTILHGMWLLVFVVAIPFVLNYIPRSALGALLVYTGFKLVNIKDIKSLWETSRGEVGIYFATVSMIVCTDLLIGVLVGVALSAIKLLVRFSSLKVHLETSDGGRNARLQLDGAATFLSLPKLAGELERVPAGATLHVDFEHLSYIDHACLELLMDWAPQHAGCGGNLILDWNELHARFTSDAPRSIIQIPSQDGQNDPETARELTA
jgi:MFS superfamily sulfate permease-like transporter